MRKGLLYCVTAGFLTLLLCLSVRAEGTALTVSLPLRQHVTNGLPVRVLYTLTADTPDAPMPEGSANGVFRMLLQNEQDTALPPITYTAPGVWTYTLRAETAGGTLSPERLRIQVEIVETAGELLPMVVALLENGEKTELLFLVTPEQPPPPPGYGTETGGPGVGGTTACGVASFGLLVARNPEVVAWLTLEDTGVDYPVTQGKNNQKYINTSALGEFSLSGAIFADARNAPDFSDTPTILYGHNMTGEAMFGSLDRYEDGAYFAGHLHGTLYHGGQYDALEVFAFFETSSHALDIYRPELEREELGDWLELVRARAGPLRRRRGTGARRRGWCSARSAPGASPGCPWRQPSWRSAR
ncbi:MAG: class B sortase [Oscillospiraceae bacterium]|nr:class B sortase [Oscillospiraceae bacterium]